MINYTDKLNVQLGEAECLNQEAVIFCFQNLIKRFDVSSELVEEALIDAGYDEYTKEDVFALQDVIDEYGSAEARGQILDKAIWFDANIA